MARKNKRTTIDDKSRRTFLQSATAGLLATPFISTATADDQYTSSDPDLETLRSKWFLTFDDDVAFPPSRRHTGSRLKPYVNADVTPIYDGRSFMERWYDTVTEMTESNPEESAVYHQTWHLGDVPLLGAQRPDTNAVGVIKDAADAGVDMNITISGNSDSIYEDTSQSWNLDMESVAVDSRFPEAGSIHQKFNVFDSPSTTAATVGSVDLYASRWGERPYESDNPDRPGDKPDHDLSVWLEGPVVRELQKVYLDRWNDDSRDNWYGNLGRGWTPPKLEEDLVDPGTGGDQQVQILQTYGQSDRSGYSWSDRGEFSIWAAYKKALQNAQDYAYIECQFFLPEGSDPWFSQDGRKQKASLFTGMANALRRGVDIVVLTVDEAYYDLIERHRHSGINFLREVAANAPGDFKIATLHNGEEHVYIHSKLLMVDDEVTYLGSANIGRRSMTHDGELQLAIIDEQNEFTRDMRAELWRAYLQSEDIPEELLDSSTAVPRMIDAIEADEGLLQELPEKEGGLSWWEKNKLDWVYDPYGGPAF